MYLAGPLWRDLRRAWASGGARGLLTECRESLIFPVFRHGRLLVIETRLDEVPPLASPEGVHIEEYRSNDWSPFSRIVPERVVRRLRRAAGAGRTCIAAWRGDHVIGYTWVSQSIAHRIETYPIPLPTGAAYGWNLFVTPSERTAGVGSALLEARHRLARDRGYRVIWRGIDATNRATRRTVQKTWTPGSRMVGELLFVHVLGFAAGMMRATADALVPANPATPASAESRPPPRHAR